MAEILDSFDDLLDDPIDQNTEPQEPVNQDGQDQSNTGEPQNTEENLENEENQENQDQEEIDYSENSIYSFLQQRGVKDPSKVQLENEDGSVEELDFNSLSPEEQLDILNQVSDPGLSENEIQTINYLRQNGNVTLEQVIDYFSQQRLNDYLAEHPEDKHQKIYEIDDYTDDDLYLIDLKNRYPDFSDEELVSKLDAAKENKELFAKESEVLRKKYKDMEDQAAKQQQQNEEQQIEDLRNSLLNVASNFNEIQLDYKDDKSDSLVVEDADKQQMISYILDQDKDGKSQLIKDLEDPEMLMELA